MRYQKLRSQVSRLIFEIIKKNWEVFGWCIFLNSKFNTMKVNRDFLFGNLEFQNKCVIPWKWIEIYDFTKNVLFWVIFVKIRDFRSKFELFHTMWLKLHHRKNLSTVPSHNNHIFMRPKKVCLLWEKCLFREKVLIIGSGG